MNGFRKKKLLKADRRRRLTASASLLVLATVFVLTGAAAADDQQKAEKELRRVTSMAMDPAARPLVSETVAEFLKVPRAEVVKVRRATNLSYGSIFLAYRLASGEAALEKLSTELHAGKTIWQVGNEEHADWRRIASDSKKLNDHIEAAFYNFFKDGKAEVLRTTTDGYDAAKDSVPADQEGITKQDIANAQDTYRRCFQRARGGEANPSGGPDERDHTPPQAQGDPR